MKGVIRCLLFLSLFSVILLSICGCSEHHDDEVYDGLLSPENGPVIALIDGEEFHYAKEYLLFRDLSPYPEDYHESVPPGTAFYSNYGEMALGLELAYREATANGFSFSSERLEKIEKGYTDLIEVGLESMYETELQSDSENSREFTDMYRSVLDTFEEVKDFYHLESNAELAKLTYPIYKNEYNTSEDGEVNYEVMMDEEAARSFWVSWYEPLLEKYHVELRMN